MWIRLLTIFVALLAFDVLYIQFIYGSFSKMIQRIQGSPMTVRLGSGLVCYLALTGLLYYFIVRERRPATDAALLGLGTYAVYEATSYALMKNWDLQVAVIDTLWGGALFYLVASLVYWLKV